MKPLIVAMMLATCCGGPPLRELDAGSEPDDDAGSEPDAGAPVFDAGAPAFDAGSKYDAGTPPVCEDRSDVLARLGQPTQVCLYSNPYRVADIWATDAGFRCAWEPADPACMLVGMCTLPPNYDGCVP